MSHSIGFNCRKWIQNKPCYGVKMKQCLGKFHICFISKTKEMGEERGKVKYIYVPQGWSSGRKFKWEVSSGPLHLPWGPWNSYTWPSLAQYVVGSIFRFQTWAPLGFPISPNTRLFSLQGSTFSCFYKSSILQLIFPLFLHPIHPSNSSLLIQIPGPVHLLVKMLGDE